MTPQTFRAMVVASADGQTYVRKIQTKTVADLPDTPVLIKVLYSSLNYKDALSAIGNKGITRHYPHTPGIDAAGEVVEAGSGDLTAGQKVIVTGYDLGMNTPGGFGQYIRVPSEWVVPLPEGLTLKESMIFGTAGFTAGLAMHKLERAGLTPDGGEILITGASGGVGTLAVSLMAHRGYHVTAASGKPTSVQWLLSLGARQVIRREELCTAPDKALLPKRWAGAIDTVGGDILSSAIRALAPNGVIASCGNAASPELKLTVFPFIIRGVSLLGIDSATCPMPIRKQIWQRLAGEWKPPNLHAIFSEITLDQLEEQILLMVKGQSMGRKVVAL